MTITAVLGPQVPPLTFGPPGLPRNATVRKWLATLKAEGAGEWAIYHRTYQSYGAAALITSGRQYGVKSGEFQASMRKDSEGNYWLYARYVGAA
jgi:hypothetical protein